MLWEPDNPVPALAVRPVIPSLGAGRTARGRNLKGGRLSMAPEDENQGPSIDDFKAAMREATRDGMKDYDRERDEWEAAVAEQERARKESENDNPPKNQG